MTKKISSGAPRAALTPYNQLAPPPQRWRAAILSALATLLLATLVAIPSVSAEDRVKQAPTIRPNDVTLDGLIDGIRGTEAGWKIDRLQPSGNSVGVVVTDHTFGGYRIVEVTDPLTNSTTQVWAHFALGFGLLTHVGDAYKLPSNRLLCLRVKKANIAEWTPSECVRTASQDDTLPFDPHTLRSAPYPDPPEMFNVLNIEGRDHVVLNAEYFLWAKLRYAPPLFGDNSPVGWVFDAIPEDLYLAFLPVDAVADWLGHNCNLDPDDWTEGKDYLENVLKNCTQNAITAGLESVAGSRWVDDTHWNAYTECLTVLVAGAVANFMVDQQVAIGAVVVDAAKDFIKTCSELVLEGIFWPTSNENRERYSIYTSDKYVRDLLVATTSAFTVTRGNLFGTAAGVGNFLAYTNLPTRQPKEESFWWEFAMDHEYLTGRLNIDDNNEVLHVLRHAIRCMVRQNSNINCSVPESTKEQTQGLMGQIFQPHGASAAEQMEAAIPAYDRYRAPRDTQWIPYGAEQYEGYLHRQGTHLPSSSFKLSQMLGHVGLVNPECVANDTLWNFSRGGHYFGLICGHGWDEHRIDMLSISLPKPSASNQRVELIVTHPGGIDGYIIGRSYNNTPVCSERIVRSGAGQQGYNLSGCGDALQSLHLIGKNGLDRQTAMTVDVFDGYLGQGLVDWTDLRQARKYRIEALPPVPSVAHTFPAVWRYHSEPWHEESFTRITNVSPKTAEVTIDAFNRSGNQIGSESRMIEPFHSAWVSPHSLGFGPGTSDGSIHFACDDFCALVGSAITEAGNLDDSGRPEVERVAGYTLQPVIATGNRAYDPQLVYAYDEIAPVQDRWSAAVATWRLLDQHSLGVGGAKVEFNQEDRRCHYFCQNAFDISFGDSAWVRAGGTFAWNTRGLGAGTIGRKWWSGELDLRGSGVTENQPHHLIGMGKNMEAGWNFTNDGGRRSHSTVANFRLPTSMPLHWSPISPSSWFTVPALERDLTTSSPAEIGEYTTGASVLIQNVGSTSTRVTLDLYKEDGTSLGSDHPVLLDPGEVHHYNTWNCGDNKDLPAPFCTAATASDWDGYAIARSLDGRPIAGVVIRAEERPKHNTYGWGERTKIRSAFNTVPGQGPAPTPGSTSD